MRTALREYAAGLGEVRDLQVLREIVAEHGKGDVAELLAKDIDRGLMVGWQRIEREFSTPHHDDLHDALASLLLGADPEGTNVDKRVRKAGKRADKRLARAGDDVRLLHEARKAAKAARYAAEAAGGRKEMVDRHERVQDLLGRHHDLAIAAAWVDRAALPPALGPDRAELAERLRSEAEGVRREAIACLP